ncbi:MAG: flavin reductase family protein [Candidatus Lokiarchaeota archaeon]|nr:flavin reductase family protein [Candidatus Lokiarchaeota archaeon]
MNETRMEINPYDYIEYFVGPTANIVSMDKNGRLNVMALLWKQIGELWHEPIITIAVSPSRYTFTLLTEGVREYTINIPSKKIMNSIEITGSLSGRDIDKFEKANLETIPGEKTQVPTLKDSLLSYECEIVHETESGNMAPHHLFFGRILKAYASKEILEKKN